MIRALSLACSISITPLLFPLLQSHCSNTKNNYIYPWSSLNNTRMDALKDVGPVEKQSPGLS